MTVVSLVIAPPAALISWVMAFPVYSGGTLKTLISNSLVYDGLNSIVMSCITRPSVKIFSRAALSWMVNSMRFFEFGSTIPVTRLSNFILCRAVVTSSKVVGLLRICVVFMVLMNLNSFVEELSWF